MGLYDTTIGTLLVGIFFNTFLYGLVTYQFALYYRTKFDDPPRIKYMVLFLFVLDTFHSASAIYMAWYYIVTNYDNPAVLELLEWPYSLTPIGTALAALVTHIFLGHRIWLFTNSKILYGMVILLAIPSFVLGTVCSIEALIILVSSELPRITPIVIAWLTMQLFVDTFITATFTIIFSRSRTGFRRTDTVLNQLIRGTIHTGLFTGIFSLGDLVSFVVLPTTNLHGMFAIPLGRIYTNTLMHNLLARESFQAELFGTRDESKMHSSSPVMWKAADSFQVSSKLMSTGNQIQVQVQRSVEEMGNPSTSSLNSENAKCKVPPPPV